MKDGISGTYEADIFVNFYATLKLLALRSLAAAGVAILLTCCKHTSADQHKLTNSIMNFPTPEYSLKQTSLHLTN